MSALTVLGDALVLRQSCLFVYRTNAENIAECVAVDIGDNQGELWEGDIIALRGAEGLSDSALVGILSQDTTALDTSRDTG